LAAEWSVPWKSLVSTILSARTRDDKTISVSNLLYSRYRSVRELAGAKLRDVEKVVKPINFYKTKAKNIVACAKMIVEKHKGRIPRNFDELVELPGVGRKTANVFLAHQGGARIGVDTHVGYISRRMGWTKHEKQDKVEGDLERLFPKSKWREINYILVRFGQTHRSKRKKNEILDRIRKGVRR
jgi:endonuclease III